MSILGTGFNPTTKSSFTSLTDLPSGVVAGRATKTSGTDGHSIACSTYGQKYGKKYLEFVSRDHGATGQKIVGMALATTTTNTYYPGNASLGVGYGFRQNDGYKVNASTFTAYGSAWNSASPTVIGMAVDFDNLKIWFSVNNVWQASGDPVAGTGQAFTITTPSTGFYYPSATCYSTTNPSVIDIVMNVADLTYTPPTGFEAWENNIDSSGVDAIINDSIEYATTTLIGISPINPIPMPFPTVLPEGSLRVAADNPAQVILGNAPVSRIIDIFDTETNVHVARTVSSAIDGTYSFGQLPNREYFVICRGINGENDTIHTRVAPV